jgi:hypothetical protein
MTGKVLFQILQPHPVLEEHGVIARPGTASGGSVLVRQPPQHTHTLVKAKKPTPLQMHVVGFAG